MLLADFGFADYIRPDVETEGGLRGSPLYMAPEIVTRGLYSASADLWSIGELTLTRVISFDIPRFEI